jgi:hypothetical protein
MKSLDSAVKNGAAPRELSEDELSAVAGGAQNIDNPFVQRVLDIWADYANLACHK